MELIEQIDLSVGWRATQRDARQAKENRKIDLHCDIGDGSGDVIRNHRQHSQIQKFNYTVLIAYHGGRTIQPRTIEPRTI